MTPLLLLRVHTDQRLGLGHVARAMAIQAAWKALGGTAVLAVSGDARAARIGAGRHPWTDAALPMESVYLGEDLHAPVPESLKTRGQVALLDLWDADASMVAALRPLRVAILEDDGDAHEVADLLFQPYLEGVSWPAGPAKVVNGHKVKPLETRRGTCRVLRGAPYIVVSPQARQMRPRREPLQPLSVHRLLATFGGTDGPGLAQRAHQVLRTLVLQDRWRGTCTLVAPQGVKGATFPGLTVLDAVPDLVRRIQDHDAVWCAGGLTLAEAACLGVPAAAWGQNRRQHLMISDLALANGCLNLGLGPEEDLAHTSDALERWLGPEGQDGRQELTRDGMTLVDGGGAARIAQELWTLARGY
jgi:spore coat polysaccharide biosynthesis predicted glycosyltransferase SpsG